MGEFMQKRCCIPTIVLIDCLILVSAVGCDRPEDRNKSSAAGAQSRVAQQDNSRSAPMTFADALSKAQNPIVKRISYETFRGQSTDLVVSSTAEFAALNRTEALFALSDDLPFPEFVNVIEVDGVRTTGEGFAPKSGSFNSHSAFIRYADIPRFANYYKSFMTEHGTKLQRQAAAAEFQRELLKVHTEYRAIADANSRVLFKKQVTGIPLRDEMYDFAAKRLNLGLACAFPVFLFSCMGENVTQEQKRCHFGPLSWNNLDESEKFIRDYPALRNLSVPMTVAEAERVIALTRKTPPKLTVLYKNGGPFVAAEQKNIEGYINYHLLRGISIVGIRVSVGNDDEAIFSHAVSE